LQRLQRSGAGVARVVGQHRFPVLVT
jgi:hypothetical protein